MKNVFGFLSLAIATVCSVSTTVSASEAALKDSPFSPYILNGSDTDISEAPWQAYVESHLFDKVGRCGGTVIEDNKTGEAKWILTAAHCFDIDYDISGIVITMLPQDAADVFVSTGEADTQAPEFKARAVSARKVYIHAGWDNESHSMNADIALIELDSSVASPAKAIKIASTSVQAAYDNAAWQNRYAPEKSQLISGYGFINPRHSQFDMPRKLQSVNTYAITDEACRQEFNTFSNQHDALLPSMLDDDNAFICAGAESVGSINPIDQIGACQGDSGGPMVWKDTHSQEQYLVGVTSWGGSYFGSIYRCGNTSAVYTQVSNYTAWIEACMDGICNEAKVIKRADDPGTGTTTTPDTDNGTDTKTIVPPTTNKKGGSGGSIGWLSLPFLIVISLRRRNAALAKNLRSAR
ncbi:S1 family peptidase [Enterovibrio calviensis]|uniref:S1 family peptidase n=1 Tax=Enterovibrio calviensis TaxID=91359 RepID=UPI00048369D1|nr:serine protease [Enterovibrio calviensis]